MHGTVSLCQRSYYNDYFTPVWITNIRNQIWGLTVYTANTDVVSGHNYCLIKSIKALNLMIHILRKQSLRVCRFWKLTFRNIKNGLVLVERFRLSIKSRNPIRGKQFWWLYQQQKRFDSDDVMMVLNWLNIRFLPWSWCKQSHYCLLWRFRSVRWIDMECLCFGHL